MNYESFKDELKAELEKSPDVPKSLVFIDRRSNNGTITKTLVIKDENRTIAPSIHLESFFENYLDGKPISQISDEIIEIYNSQPDFSGVNFSIEWERIKDRIIFSLISYNANYDYLQNMPHVKVSDLALIFKFDTEFLGISGYITITKEILAHIEKEVSDLFLMAEINTPKLLPFEPFSFDEVIDFSKYDEEDLKKVNSMIFAITNTDKDKGAGAIFYDEFPKLLKKMDWEKAYALPSSVHEFIIVKYESDAQKKELDEMVREVNRTIFEADYLSDHCYPVSELLDDYAKAREGIIQSLQGNS